jgi:hypothetical protein
VARPPKQNKPILSEKAAFSLAMGAAARYHTGQRLSTEFSIVTNFTIEQRNDLCYNLRAESHKRLGALTYLHEPKLVTIV